MTQLRRKTTSIQHDGQSLGPHLLGKPSDDRKFCTVNFPDMGAGGMDGKWKGVRQDINRKKASLELELFDLSADESETIDLASKHPDIVLKIERL